VNIEDAFSKGKFREDLYYRLNQVPINMPPLRKRAEDIHLLFRKFTTDFSEMHRMPPLSLNPEAVEVLENYSWPGNIRQLKHITEQMSVLEADRRIDSDTILSYLPETHRSRLPVRITAGEDGFEDDESGTNEKKMLYKVLVDMKSELDDLKRVVLDIIEKGGQISNEDKEAVQRALSSEDGESNLPVVQDAVEVESSLSLIDSERELIIKALDKHKNKRKMAAAELGISERTLYRKIKEYDLK
jgi:DNA-binding NtrC family response regulator